ncbi:hypothetical protein CHX26_03495 [Porphyrobacter sp. HT-58-2]|uniref:hypothetical protein n=1 Tax=Porphyrobacter sp. HT-58-2 TaxID=2023229 RepID=UPI000CDBDBBC|nr:hypothetical protein [Porphyrobacter sp. HT-58-2]AUX68696.1 hypothetical protein CHX26_03495 [Porphyrobacter sp. HT-58-2]
MPEFRFLAPSLIDRGATVEAATDAFHDAPGAGDRNAPYKRFASWLATRLQQSGYRVDGPEPDENGWILAIPSNGASAQLVIYTGLGGPDEIVLDLLLLGPADPAIADACATILRASPEIRELTIED